MNYLNELIQILNQCDTIQETVALRKRIEEHPTLLQMYRQLTEKQKEIVQKTVQSHTLQQDLLNQRSVDLDQLTSHPLVQNYLHNLEEIQELVDAITDIISQECTLDQSVL